MSHTSTTNKGKLGTLTPEAESESDDEVTEKQRKKNAKATQDVDPGMFTKVLMLNRPDWLWLILGTGYYLVYTCIYLVELID